MLLRTLGCCLMLAVSSVAAQEGRLLWLINDFPPFTEVSQQTAGQGIADSLMQHVQSHLPQYRHETEVASFARVYALMERGEQVCHPTTLKMPGREHVMLFSRPALFLTSQQVVIRADRQSRFAPYIDSSGQIDVSRLLADAQLVTAVSERRGYSVAITNALKALGDQPHVLKAGVNFTAPFQQLAAGWIDYLFAYPVELGRYRRQPGVVEVAMQTLEIAGDPPYMLGYISCTRSVWGEQVIRDIDEQIRLAGPRPPWVEKIVEYTASEDLETYERALVEQHPFSQR